VPSASGSFFAGQLPQADQRGHRRDEIRPRIVVREDEPVGHLPWVEQRLGRVPARLRGKIPVTSAPCGNNRALHPGEMEIIGRIGGRAKDLKITFSSKDNRAVNVKALSAADTIRRRALRAHHRYPRMRTRLR
jgi:hypothetical protein